MCGSASFGDAELLALAIGTGAGGRSALEISLGLIERFGGVPGLLRAQAVELEAVPGIGPERAVRLHASLELGRRATRPVPDDRPVVTSPQAAFSHLAPRMVGLADEELRALYLDRKRRLVADRQLTTGNDSYTVVDPRQVFRIAIGLGAAAVLVAHNHPSGDPTPSPQDVDVTRRLASAGRVLGLPLLDHLVIGAGVYTSFAEQGQLPSWAEEAPWTAHARDVTGRR